MSEDIRLTLLREGVEAFNRGDAGPALALLADDVECYVAPDLMNTGTYIGPDGYLEMTRTWGEAWDSVSADILGVEELENGYLLAEIHQRAVGAGSGVPVEMTIYWLFRFLEGEVTRFHMYGTREAAVAATRE